MCENMMGLRKTAPICTSPGPLCAEDDFVSLASVIIIEHLLNVKRCLPLTFIFQAARSLLFPIMYPVALGPGNTAEFVLVRSPWLVTVWLTHSAVM